MKELLKRLVREEEGQDLIEYGLLAAFISLVAVAGATLLGSNLNSWYGRMGSNVASWSPS